MRVRVRGATARALALALALASLAGADARETRFGRERLVMQTTLGDVTLALYDHDDAARATAAHVLEAFELGLYDTNHFFRVDRGFVAQIADCAGGRRAAMSERQRAAATRTVRGEFDASVKHTRGKLSMARWSDPDSATSSFFGDVGDGAALGRQVRRVRRDGRGRGDFAEDRGGGDDEEWDFRDAEGKD